MSNFSINIICIYHFVARGESEPVLKDIDLSIPESSIIAATGSSGTGKYRLHLSLEKTPKIR